MKYPDSIKLAAIPTKIEKLDRLSRELKGPEIYIKRDDLTGCVTTGNKIRKLEFVVADALNKKADTLVTCGGIQSNHARATAFVAAKLGMRSILVLRGEPPGDIDGNLFLDNLVSAEVRFVTREQYKDVDRIMADISEELSKEGRKGYPIPTGASDALGTFGYIKAAEEIKRQLEDMNLKINMIVTAVGSGGTYAGLLLGKKLHNLEVDIYGVNVCETPEYFVDKIQEISSESIKKYNLKVSLSKDEIKIIGGYVGKGYAESRPGEIELIKKIARLEGIVLDPVYTAKAMFGLIDQIEKGKFGKQDRILFIHTGGIFGLFPKRGLF